MLFLFRKPPRVIATVEPSPAASLSLLCQLGLFDRMSVDERVAFCERGEIWATPSGRRIIRLVEAVA